MKTRKWTFLFLVFLCILSSAFAESEPNNTWGTANVVAVGDNISGVLGVSGDNDDWYKITLPNDGELKVWGIVDATLDIGIDIFDVNGTDWIGDRFTNLGFGLTDTTRHTHLKAGTYFIRTWNAQGSGPYTLKNKFKPTGIPIGNDNEPNDQFEKAETTVINGQNTGHLGYFSNRLTDNDDWFKITLPYDGELKVWGIIDATLDIGIDIFDVNGRDWIGNRYTNLGFGITDSTRHTRLKAGIYYIKTWNAQGYGSYTLKNKFKPTGIPNGNDNEPNDEFLKAETVVINDQKTGHLGYFSNGSTDYEDWFKISLPNDGELKVWGVIDPTLDIGIEIFDVNGKDWIGDRFTNLGFGLTDTTRHTHLKAGTYFIKTWNVQGYGSYTLKNKFTPPGQNDLEPNNNSASAQLLTIETVTGGHIGFWQSGIADDEDWYKIVLPEKDNYIISIKPSPTLNVYIDLYNASSSFISGCTKCGEKGVPDTIILKGIDYGTYYIKVTHSYYESYGSYTLKAEVAKPTDLQAPVAYYPFNGNVNDESGNGWNGTFVSATSVTDRFGNTGKAYRFNGNGDYHKLPNMISKSFTVNFWVKTTMVGLSGDKWHNGNGLVDAETSGFVDDWGTSLIDGGKVAFGIGPTDVTIKSSKSINDDKWYMITATRDFTNGAFKLYMNGKLESSGIAGTNELKSAEFIGVGNDASAIGSNVDWFAGVIDDISIYKRSLTDVEISSLFNTSSGPTASITATSPNGGENWQVGSIHSITWTSTNVANVMLEYSTNNGSSWNGITTSYSASGGSYLWTVPNAPSIQCKVRVSDAANVSTVQDLSDNTFTISSSSGGTGLIAYYPFNGNVNDESGNRWNGTFVSATSVADRFGNTGKAYRFNGNGDYLKLPNIVNRSFTVNYWVKTTMVGLSGDKWHNGNGLVDAETSGFVDDWGTSLIDGGKVAFGIGPTDVTIKSSKSINDDKWYMITATRDFTNGAFKLYMNGKLESSGTAGTNELKSAEFIGIGNDASAIGSNVDWFAGTIDDISIYNRPLTDIEISSLFNTSSGPTASITATSPNGGENWQVGSIHSITWTSTNVANVMLEYSTNNGSSWNGITTSYSASGGSYIWTVPNAPSIQCKVRVSDAANVSTVQDISDNTFTISSSSGGTGLIAYYPFNGNVNDESGNRWNGTFVSATSVADRFGNTGKTYRFNGNGDYLKLPNIVSKSFTVNFWVKTTQQAISGSSWHNGNGLIDAETSGFVDDWGTSLIDGGKVAFGIGPTDVTIKSSKSINDDKWYMITATRDFSNGIFKLYINGILENSGQAGTNELKSAEFIGVGNDPNGIGANVRWFAGAIDDIKIYNSVLTESELQLLLKEGGYTGVNQSFIDQFVVFPNPSKGVINLRIGNNEIPIKLEIFDINGRMCYSSNDWVHDSKIDLSGLQKGLYLINISSKNKVIAAKLILQ